jgi:hypothetical protein
MMPDLSIWAIALEGIGIAVFTLAVTFLGDAIQYAKTEEEKTKKMISNSRSMTYKTRLVSRESLAIVLVWRRNLRRSSKPQKNLTTK